MEEEAVISTTTPEETENMDAQVENPAVKELEETFKNRFTEDDADFMEVFNREEIPPPIIANYFDLKYQKDRDDHSRHGRADDRRSERKDRDERGRGGRDDRSRGEHRRDERSRSPHKQQGPKMPNSYYFYYY